MTADWRCAAARDLAFAGLVPAALAALAGNPEAAGWDDGWDDGAARQRVLALYETAGGGIARGAERGFLVYDAAAADRPESYRMGFAVPDGEGGLLASPAGLRAAAAQLAEAGLPADVKADAAAALEIYFAKLKADPAYQRARYGAASVPTPDAAALGPEEIARLRRRDGLAQLRFGKTETADGPVITAAAPAADDPAAAAARLPLGVAECWAVAERAIAAAEVRQPIAEADAEAREICDRLLYDTLWPAIEKRLSAMLAGAPGRKFREWHEREAATLAAEMAYTARQTAREEGLRRARAIVRVLAQGLSEPDPGKRALLLTMHHEAIGRALEGRF